ncbi:hypothetical protein [Tabrizicola soli]|uniref:GNAT family N-acetyltransferase n=1 Tax=Tabrizicola soli TaxID=2185115 RepID=A0ABV7DTV7_9RHOB|nr:hypothetical protein [Tabrizicola soli]
MNDDLDEIDEEWANWERGERVFLEKLLDLLAWLIAVTYGRIAPDDRLRWPLVDLWRHEETQQLALSGPIFYELTRNQLAIDFSDDPGSFAQYDHHSDFVVKFLLINCPPKRQGQGKGRAEMCALTALMFQVHQPLNFWELPVRPADPDDCWSEHLHSEHAFSVALSARLNAHHRLADLPDAIPSPEALRRLLPKG